MQAAASLWGCLIALELCPCTSKASRPSFGSPDSLTKKFVSGSSTLGKFQLPTNIRDIVSHWNIKTKAGMSRGLTIHRELAIAGESEGNHLPPSFKHQTCPYIGWITDIDGQPGRIKCKDRVGTWYWQSRLINYLYQNPNTNQGRNATKCKLIEFRVTNMQAIPRACSKQNQSF